MKKLILTIFASTALCISASAQSAIMKDFKPVCDSLDVLIKENRDVKAKLYGAIRRAGLNGFREF